MGCAASQPEPPKKATTKKKGHKSKKNIAAQQGSIADFFAELAEKRGETTTDPTNLREFVRVPDATDIAYQPDALSEKEQNQVCNLAPHQFSDIRVGLRTLKGMHAADAKTGRAPYPKSENQDALMVTRLALGDAKAMAVLAGVYDGHGVMGRVMSMVVARHVATAMKAKEAELSTDTAALSDELKTIMEAADLSAEKEVYKDAYKKSGSTATVAVLTAESLVVAQLGDSRLLKLSATEGEDKPWSITTETRLHAVDDPDELARLKAAGGEILYPPPEKAADTPVRIQAYDPEHKGTRLALAMSRSFGDGLLKKVGVTATPEMLTTPISAVDRCVVIGCDGVFDFVSDAECCDIAYAYRHSALAAAEAIEKVAASRQDNTDDGYRDDTTCCVLFLPLLEKTAAGGNMGFALAKKSSKKLLTNAALKKWGPGSGKIVRESQRSDASWSMRSDASMSSMRSAASGESRASLIDQSGAVLGDAEAVPPEEAMQGAEVPQSVAALDMETLGELVAVTLDYLSKLNKSRKAVPETDKILETAQAALIKLGCTEGKLADRQKDVEKVISELVA